MVASFGSAFKVSVNPLIAWAKQPTRVISSTALYPGYPSVCKNPLNPFKNSLGCSLLLMVDIHIRKLGLNTSLLDSLDSNFFSFLNLLI